VGPVVLAPQTQTYATELKKIQYSLKLMSNVPNDHNKANDFVGIPQRLSISGDRQYKMLSMMLLNHDVAQWFAVRGHLLLTLFLCPRPPKVRFAGFVFTQDVRAGVRKLCLRAVTEERL
jgi:hypothetical protein